MDRARRPYRSGNAPVPRARSGNSPAAPLGQLRSRERAAPHLQSTALQSSDARPVRCSSHCGPDRGSRGVVGDKDHSEAARQATPASNPPTGSLRAGLTATLHLVTRMLGLCPGKAAGYGLDRLRIRRGARDHSGGGFDCAGPAGLDEPCASDHEGVIRRCRTAGRGCAQDRGGMPEASITGRGRKLVEPLRDSGAIGCIAFERLLTAPRNAIDPFFPPQPWKHALFSIENRLCD